MLPPRPDRAELGSSRPQPSGQPIVYPVRIVGHPPRDRSVLLATTLSGIDHEVLQTRQVGVVDCEVPDELSGLGVVLLESGSTETVNELRVGDGILGIIEIAYRVGVIGPVRPPEGLSPLWTPQFFDFWDGLGQGAGRKGI